MLAEAVEVVNVASFECQSSGRDATFKVYTVTDPFETAVKEGRFVDKAIGTILTAV